MMLEEKTMRKFFQREVDDPQVYGINVAAGRKKKYNERKFIYLGGWRGGSYWLVLTTIKLYLYVAGVEFVHALQDLALTSYISLLQNLHRLISPLLVPAVLDQPPFTILKGGGRNYSLVPKHCLKTTEDITVLLDEMLGLLQSNRVFSSVVKQFFIQTFYLINVTLFNHLMKGDIHSNLKENEIGDENSLYTATNAFQIKVALSQLVAWIFSHAKFLAYNATKYALFS